MPSVCRGRQSRRRRACCAVRVNRGERDVGNCSRISSSRYSSRNSSSPRTFDTLARLSSSISTTLGPWATSEIIDTIGASTSGTVVMSPSALSNGGQNFRVWLRHQ